MKKGILISALLAFVFLSHAQETQPNQTPVDSIVELNGTVLLGDVTIVTPTYVSFVLQGTPEEYAIERKEVHKIVYKTGRIEILNKLAFELLDDSMWEAVWLTEKENEVGDLYMLGEIEATSPSSAQSASAAKKGATIKLQKRAASMNGTVILVTKRQNTGGYGEYPGYYIRGKVYGPNPLEDAPAGGTGASLGDAGN